MAILPEGKFTDCSKQINPVSGTAFIYSNLMVNAVNDSVKAVCMYQAAYICMLTR